MTVGECKALLAIAGRNYDRAIDPELAKDWAIGLSDITDVEGLAALRWHMKNSRFFPTIADIREGARLAAPPRLYLVKHVDDPIPHEEVRGVIGRILAKLKGGI